MQKPDESRVIHFGETQAHIPGPNGDRSINFLRRGSLDVNLSRPLPRTSRPRTHRPRSTSLIQGRGVLRYEGKRESIRGW
jgi:hypothetical protein